MQAQTSLHRVEADCERLARERRTLESELQNEVSVRKRAESELLALRSVVVTQNSELEQRAARILVFEARIGELEASTAELLTLRARIAELEVRLKETAQVAPPIAASSSSNQDDLQEIRGIGPAFARALRVRGVLRFAQIAAWTEADIAEIGKSLRIQAARIQREDWVGSAKSLLSEGDSPAMK